MSRHAVGFYRDRKGRVRPITASQNQFVSSQLLERADAKKMRIYKEIERTKDAPMPTKAQKSLPPSEFYRETRDYQEKLFWEGELRNVEKAEENYKKSPSEKNAQILEYAVSSQL